MYGANSHNCKDLVHNLKSQLTCVILTGEETVGESCCGDCWRWRSEVRVSGTTGGCRR